MWRLRGRGLFMSHWGRDVTVAVAALTAGYLIFSPAKPAAVLGAANEKTAPSQPSKKPDIKSTQSNSVSAAAIAAGAGKPQRLLRHRASVRMS
jgi:hypothetical protein